MATKITRDVLESYLYCKTKAHLKLAGQQGSVSDYEALLAENRQEVRQQAIGKILAKHAEGELARDIPLTAAALRAGPSFVLDAILEDDLVSLRFDGLKRVDGPSKLGDFHYVPILFHEGRRVGTFARWRCWKEYGTGVAGDLLVHLISGMQRVLGINEIPTRVSAFGGIYRWKDGRNMPDVHPVLFEYSGIPVYMRLSLGCESAEVTRFQGSKGVIELREFSVTYIPQSGVDTSPSYYTSSYPARLRNAYLQQWHQEHDPVPGKEPAPETITYNGNDYDDLKPHLWKFFEAVRSRQPLLQDMVFGHNAALACHLANESYFRKSPVSWDESSQSIKSLA
jgi:hypothetical protein